MSKKYVLNYIVAPTEIIQGGSFPTNFDATARYNELNFSAIFNL